MKDLKIVEALRLHSEKAFDYVYNNNYKLVYYIILARVNDVEVANTLLVEVFTTMYNTISKYKGKSLRVWLATLALLKSEDYLDNHPDLGRESKLLKELSQILTLEEFDVLNYHAVFDIGFKEIGIICDMSKKEAHSIYRKAIFKLKAEM